jgi:hypothetical protein
MTAEDRSSGALERARLQRAGLRHAIGTVEAALAAPAGGDRVSAWGTDVGARLARCSARSMPTSRSPSTPTGRLDEIVRLTPRLAGACARLPREDVEIQGLLGEQVASLGAAPPVPDSQWSAVVVSNVRHEALPAQLRSRSWMVLGISSRTRTDRLSPRCRGRQRERRDGFVGIAESLDVWPCMRPRRTASLRWPSIAS